MANPNTVARNLTPDELKILSTIYDDEYVRIGPKGYCMPIKYAQYADDVYNMEVKPDDTFIVTYQRSGTTLTQELVWLVANNFDYETASKLMLSERVPFLEYACYYSDRAVKQVEEIAGVNEQTKKAVAKIIAPLLSVIDATKPPRFIKSHLPLSLLPPKLLDTAKVVYVARDPRDVLVSSYHNARLFKVHQFKGTFKDIFEVFLHDMIKGGPFFEHLKEAWALRHHPNMLFLFYEDITKKMPETIQKVSKFLGKEVTKEQIDRLCDHLSVENFKNNKSVNFEQMRECGLLHNEETFIRKGKSGGWRDYFDDEMTARMQKWIDDNLKDTDLRFPSMV